jgi:hypothetical protein
MLVRAIRRGQHGQQMIDAGTEFQCPDDDVTLTTDHPYGIGWQEPVHKTEHDALIVKRARVAIRKRFIDAWRAMHSAQRQAESAEFDAASRLLEPEVRDELLKSLTSQPAAAA